MIFPEALGLYLLPFCRIAIGLVFLLSFVGKMTNVQQFTQTIANFSVLPQRFSRAAALLFLMSEGVVIVLLAIGRKLLPFGFALAAIMLLVFCAALISVLTRNINTSCNCFGASEAPVSKIDVWRNIGFILVALVGLLTTLPSAAIAATLNITEFVLIGMVAATFIAIWINLSEIVQLFQTNQPPGRSR